MAIRLTVTPPVKEALRIAKKLYPTLSDPEILKLGLAKISNPTTMADKDPSLEEVRASASRAVGYDYLSSPDEDIYELGMGEKVNFE